MTRTEVSALKRKILISYRKDRLFAYCHCKKCGERVFPNPKGSDDDDFYIGNSRFWLELSDHNGNGCYRCSVLAAKAISHRRRKLIDQSEAHFTPNDIVEKYKVQDGRCAYCGCDLMVSKYHIDHIKPIVKGGSNGPENVQLTCPKCNLSKGKKGHEEFLMLCLQAGK